MNLPVKREGEIHELVNDGYGSSLYDCAAYCF